MKADEKKRKSGARKSRPVGASKKAQEKAMPFLRKYCKSAIKYIVAISSVGAVFAVIFLYSPKEKLQEFTNNPIRAVLIEGTFTFFSREEAEAVISNQVKGSFIDLNIQKLKFSLEESPWVDTVSIAREWPDKLVIKIIEQQAIARWGEKNFLNMRGDIISVKNVDKMGKLPFLNGNDSYAKDVMQQYLKMGKLLALNGLKLKSVALDETLAWTLITDGNIKIKLGRDRVWGKLKNLMTAKKGPLKNQFTAVRQVDMRYRSGFAISWKTIKKTRQVAEG